ncbi:hypothetical protein GJU39_10660 [Pedobacter petrophilus]|uniref:Uncharacterized protein n=2 Tax=Pedobacter petrophilus TaxID=1908241 RepID=A0A7K0FY69_9SPHI|nr:hypothetical protein [Pedobacter petrophilus]
MKFKSVGTPKPIEFTFGFQDKKGAFVWYKEKKEPIPIKFKALDIDSADRESGQPDFYHYRYTEMYNGKASGEYGITEWPRNVDDIYYMRYKDGKKFKFELVEDEGMYDGKSMALLHGTQIHYYSFYGDNLRFVYPDRYQEKLILSKLSKDKARHLEINDYNFDGLDDIAFGKDSFNGQKVVFDIHDIFIFNSKNKRFDKLQIPKSGTLTYFSDLKINTNRKELTTKRKIGDRWNSYTYGFDKMGILVLIKNDK